jgi:hypothetical protein
MLKDWIQSWSGTSDKDKKESLSETGKTAAGPARLDFDPENQKSSPVDPVERREEEILRKLRESAKEAPPTPNNVVTYDSVFRTSSRILLDGNQHETHDGLQVNVGRNAQNCMVSSKWQFGNPQSSGWDINLQMNGFSDMTSVGYSTTGRWSLMYQRVFKSHAMAVLQFMAQPQAMAMGGPAGTFFGLMQYPWVTGGCSQLSYVKSQNFSLNHMQRIIRGVYAGAQMSYDPNTRGTTLSYGLSATNPAKSSSFGVEVKPHSGEWKMAFATSDWESDMELATQLEYTEKRNGKVSILSIGMRKNLIGGGVINCVLSGFSKLKANLDFPFGGSQQGLNQMGMSYSLQYDLHSGGLKHGVTLNL